MGIKESVPLRGYITLTTTPGTIGVIRDHVTGSTICRELVICLSQGKFDYVPDETVPAVLKGGCLYKMEPAYEWLVITDPWIDRNNEKFIDELKVSPLSGKITFNGTCNMKFMVNGDLLKLISWEKMPNGSTPASASTASTETIPSIPTSGQVLTTS